MSSILIIEDEQLLAESVAKFFGRRKHEVMTERTGERGLEAFREAPSDLVLLDFKLPGMDGLEVLRKLKEMEPAIPVIMMTAYGTVETAVEAMKLGAYDYVEKPVDLLKLEVMATKMFESVKLKQEVTYYRGRAVKHKEPEGIIGNSPALKKTLENIRNLVKYDSPGEDAPTVLICGETGTGKEVFARAIHRMGPRASNPFIEINCTALPENLIEAELFGYRKGAFTDAKTGKAGLIEAARGGALLLDEIGHLGHDMQAKLLKVVEEKVVRRIGELQDRHIDVKIIAATNRDLDTARKQGIFREDLYHRLNVIRIDLPPLRERGDDVLLLADAFLERYAKKYNKPIKGFTKNARKQMLEYSWPGNVRELHNIIERVVLLENVEELSAEHLGLAVDSFDKSPEPAGGGPKEQVDESASGNAIKLPSGGIALGDVERDLISQALERTRWNRSKAARLLGISLDTLRYRIEKYGLDP